MKTRVLCLTACALLWVSSARGAEVLSTFSCKEQLGHDWPRTLLHYDVAFVRGKARVDKTELMDSNKRPVEFQLLPTAKYSDGSIKTARISFYAELPKAGLFAYQLQTAKQPKPFLARVQAKRKGDVLEVTSPVAGVRLPAPAVKRFKQPVPPKQVPAPILGYRLSNGQWAGKGWLASDRKVASWSQQVIADGALYKEYSYQVRFTPSGFYKARVRVEAEAPLVHVSEEYDFGAATAGRDFFVLSLNDGWKPDTVMWAASSASGPGNRFSRMRNRRIEHDTDVWREPVDFSADREHTHLSPGFDWGPNAVWYGLFADKDGAASPFAGVMSEHMGAWRSPYQSQSPLQWTKSGSVLAKFRISLNLIGAPQNPFSTAEIDPDSPPTLGRRQWALVLGSLPQGDKQLYDDMDFYRSYQGYISLDDYKDWVLDWDEKAVSRPRVMSTPALLARLKANLDRCPGKELIKNTYLISGDPQRAIGEANEAVSLLTHNRFPPMLAYYQSHYRQTESDYAPVFAADSALTCKELPADLRRSLRAKIAAMCYLLTNPDFNPRGAGVHMGNPNMAINRAMSLPLYATLIADHPLAKKWLNEAATYTKWKSAYNTTSGGGVFRENPGYATYGPMVFLSTAAIALRNAGYDLDRWKPLKNVGRYFTDFETPPTIPRGKFGEFQRAALANRKIRVLPGFGNGNDVIGGQVRMLLASLTARSDPEYAARMMGGWQQAGAFFGTQMTHPQFWFYWNPDIEAIAPQREDKVLTGFGGVLRAHSETPEETYAVLRQGYMQSHWNPDQGTFVLYARGVCLAPPTGWAYSGIEGMNHDSKLSFGDPLADPEHGHVDTNIEDYGSTPSLGYLLGRQTFLKRWDKSKRLKNDFGWSRQVLLLRSPRPDGANYVVLRDSTRGNDVLPSWWHQWFTAKAENVKPNGSGVRIEAGEDVKLDVAFVEPAHPSMEIKGAKIDGFQEDYSQVSIPQEAGQGFLTVFYPFKGREAGLGKVEKIADGLIKITTPESEDYVFASADKPVIFKNGLLDINANAGAVRVFKDKVLLINASGQYGKVGYKGVVAQGLGPFEQSAAAGSGHIGRTIASLSKPTGKGNLLTVEGADGIKGWILVDGDKETYVATEGNGKIAYKDFYVKGEAPFVVTHEPGKVTLTSQGRRRIFQMPIPQNIVPPNLLPPLDNLPADFLSGWKEGGYLNWPWAIEAKVDGVTTEAGWYDGKMTIGLDEGKHTAVITPYTNPPIWTTRAAPNHP